MQYILNIIWWRVRNNTQHTGDYYENSINYNKSSDVYRLQCNVQWRMKKHKTLPWRTAIYTTPNVKKTKINMKQVWCCNKEAFFTNKMLLWDKIKWEMLDTCTIKIIAWQHLKSDPPWSDVFSQSSLILIILTSKWPPKFLAADFFPRNVYFC